MPTRDPEERRRAQAESARRRRAKKGVKPDAKHGAAGAYQAGCRCTPCEEWNRARVRRQPSSRQRARSRPTGTSFKHGTTTGCDHHGCRCTPCSAAYIARYQRAQQATRERAVHNRAPWTENEMTIAMAPDLTAKQAALLLGRSYAAVKSMRSRLIREAA